MIRRFIPVALVSMGAFAAALPEADGVIDLLGYVLTAAVAAQGDDKSDD
jgi:hypothetical protein